MQQTEQESDNSIADYILQNCQVKSRRDIDRALLADGHQKSEIKATWQSLLSRKIIVPANESSRTQTTVWRLVAFALVVTVIAGLLFGPKFGSTVYTDPDKLVREAKIGDKATVVFKGGKTMLTCETRPDSLECFWRASLNSTSGVVVSFPKSKGLAPNAGGTYHEIRILARQGERLIAEIEREVTLPS